MICLAMSPNGVRIGWLRQPARIRQIRVVPNTARVVSFVVTIVLSIRGPFGVTVPAWLVREWHFPHRLLPVFFDSVLCVSRGPMA